MAVRTDLDTDIDGDGDIDNDDDDPLEYDPGPGGYIAVSGDRKLITFNVEPYWDLYEGYVKIAITQGNTKADLYTSEISETPLYSDSITFNLWSQFWDFDYYRQHGLYIKAVEASSTLKDIEVTLTFYSPDDPSLQHPIHQDKIKLTAFKVQLLVNDTESETDDYVVLQKTGEIRLQPMLKSGETAGNYYNSIPMKIHLEGPAGFSCNVKLSDSGGETGVGDITIKKADGSAYPSEGETVTVGTDLQAKFYGTTASSNLNDVTITTKTDKTGDSICGQEDLTVIWISGENMNFRGSNNQGESLTSCSTAKIHKPGHDVFEDKVGKFIYLLPPLYSFKQFSLHNQMEISIQITPNKVISDVAWDIKREVSRVKWGPGAGTLTPMYLPTTGDDWNPDDIDYPTATDEDLEQNSDCLNIFVNDNPGEPAVGSSNDAGKRYTYKAKFREWVQVTIGGKVYVCSPYVNWRSIIHAKFQDATTGWVWDATKTTEIVPGTIENWPNTWSED